MQRLNDAPYDPSVYAIGVTLDKDILSSLKDFVEPTNMEPTFFMYVYDMFEDGVEIVIKFIQGLICRRKRLKWGKDEHIDRSVKQIEKDLDIVEMVRMQ